MTTQPDLRFDVDALFAHMRDNLDRDPDNEETEWRFTFRSSDLDKLTRIGESLAEEFDVHLQESVETYHEDGRRTMGPPLMDVVIIAALPAEEVKSLSARFADLARDADLTYEGVSASDPVDMDELFGWLDLEAAQWRLRHFSDTGLRPGEPLPFVFAVEAEDEPAAERAAQAFHDAGFTSLEIIHDEDEPGFGVLIHAEGKNDERLLADTYHRIEKIAAAHAAELLGVQFFDDEESDENDTFDLSQLDGADDDDSDDR